jgi:hypothetical protein
MTPAKFVLKNISGFCSTSSWPDIDTAEKKPATNIIWKGLCCGFSSVVEQSLSEQKSRRPDSRGHSNFSSSAPTKKRKHEKHVSEMPKTVASEWNM